MIKILLADDHSIIRAGLRQILSGQTDMEIVGEAKNAVEILELVSKIEWNVLILDITMPGRSGLEVLGDVKKRFPEKPVLILSMYPEKQFAVRALKGGASGYISKESALEELVDAIRKVTTGGKYVNESLAEVLALEIGNKGNDIPHEDLSDREFEVMRMIASGKTVSEIGRDLYLSPKTISTFRARILKKMNLRTNAELTHYAFQNKIID
jgi:two-component system invasion response regulator UvrY